MVSVIDKRIFFVSQLEEKEKVLNDKKKYSHNFYHFTNKASAKVTSDFVEVEKVLQSFVITENGIRYIWIRNYGVH